MAANENNQTKSIMLCHVSNCFSKSYTRIKNRINNHLWGLYTICFTLIGFLFSIGNDYFSQYDYKVKDICRDFFSSNKEVNFDKIRADSLMGNPKYYFILDVSMSTQSNKKREIALNNTIVEQINAIKSSGYCTHEGFDFGVKNNTIEFHRLLQVRLLHALKKLYDYQREKLDYSIVLFSENPEICPSENINKTFQLVYSQSHTSKETNFVNLVKSLHGNIVSNYGPANYYKRRECHLLFFSDYLHDPQKKKNNADDEKELTDFLWDMREKNIDIKLHYLEDENPSENGTPIEQHFFTIFPFSKIGIMDVDNGLISPLVSKNPICFHYINSLFEEKLTTQIDFSSLDRKKNLSFGLNYNSDNNDNIKQEYYLIRGVDTIHLSKHLQSREVNPTDNVTLMIKGYIPAPYKSPDIIIQDKEEGIQYVVPVAFYRKFPFTGTVLLSIILLIVGGVFFINMISWIVDFAQFLSPKAHRWLDRIVGKRCGNCTIKDENCQNPN